MVVSIDENLKEALKILKGPREKEYGDKKENHDNIATLWTAYLGPTITAHDVAVMMLLLKVARTKSPNPTKDTYVDMVGYSAIAGELLNDKSK
tara:strand:- start:617 stop:895 length:279 start_codon:yes stop_codon:yes gene_type:complete